MIGNLSQGIAVNNEVGNNVVNHASSTAAPSATLLNSLASGAKSFVHFLGSIESKYAAYTLLGFGSILALAGFCVPVSAPALLPIGLGLIYGGAAYLGVSTVISTVAHGVTHGIADAINSFVFSLGVGIFVLTPLVGLTVVLTHQVHHRYIDGYFDMPNAPSGFQRAANDNFALEHIVKGQKEIQIAFDNQKPGEKQISEIHSFIKEEKNFEALTSNNGLKAGTATLFLPEGQDFITFDAFNPATEIEWCLLHQGNHKYSLITETTAEGFISSGKHPLVQDQALTTDNILRGKAVIALLNQVSIG